jgi:polar amino acid transport system substrate-binding protein
MPFAHYPAAVRSTAIWLGTLLSVLLSLLASQPSHANPGNGLPTIRVLTSEFPPYNYDDGSGQIKGLSTEMVQAVLKELQLQAKPESMPWARSYMLAQQEPNILLHSITRTKEREHLFKWVGVIAPAEYSLWALAIRSEVNPSSLADLSKYRIGTTHSDVVDQYLRSQNIPHIDSVSGQDAYELNIKKLQLARIDLWGVSTLPGMYFVMRQGMEGKVVRVFQLKEIPGDGMYMAFGAKTDDAVVAKFRTALDSIKKKGIYHKLLAKYGLGATH